MGSEGNSNNNNNNVWKVPEMEGWKMGQREASVLRYREKRQSRLFSKRIRYQVRKLNAEKRPRMKVTFNYLLQLYFISFYLLSFI